jgi:hypothetical protein
MRFAGKLGPETALVLGRFSGIYVAEFEVGASLSPSYMRETASGGTVGNYEVVERIIGGWSDCCSVGHRFWPARAG